MDCICLTKGTMSHQKDNFITRFPQYLDQYISMCVCIFIYTYVNIETLEMILLKWSRNVSNEWSSNRCQGKSMWGKRLLCFRKHHIFLVFLLLHHVDTMTLSDPVLLYTVFRIGGQWITPTYHCWGRLFGLNTHVWASLTLASLKINKDIFSQRRKPLLYHQKFFNFFHWAVSLNKCGN